HGGMSVALTPLATVTSMVPPSKGAVDVLGAATLSPASSTLALTAGFAAPLGTIYTIVHTTAGVTGQFRGLGEGALVILSGNRYQISYKANGGKDVILTRVVNPATHFVLSAPASVTAGVAFQVTVMAEDASGHLDTC